MIYLSHLTGHRHHQFRWRQSDNMVPLLRLVTDDHSGIGFILTLRDFTVYPSTISANRAVELMELLMDVDDLITLTPYLTLPYLTHTFD